MPRFWSMVPPMRHHYLVLSFFALLLLVPRVSSAQNAPGRSGFGAGAEATSTGIVGGTFVYDAQVFHLDALLGAHLTKMAPILPWRRGSSFRCTTRRPPIFP